ncbi:acyl-CoA synthetase (AMP-forming)/AMP-acid ligase II [Microbacterium natoriense]|uniref:Acyl-CoA synthetase (AMP-forming)/AMP-acid ligase II n=1 Tax=Microbacterium natoriense TaxID=284570 RepID=A0AAW8EVD1_9MICO|nr:AMP-binding protein [Microbacterium natoriense]MDQ0646589.1 acyl-CoA synthetase (AMP-forming)/AMP-acid ligase II [Microbacterium natoriense]
MNLGRFVRATAAVQPGAEAVVAGESRLTYAQLDEASDRLAAALMDRHGLVRGDVVAVLGWNCAELVITEVALYKAGLVRAPINARLGVSEVHDVLADAGVKVLIADVDHIDLVRSALASVTVDTVITIGGASDLGISFVDALASVERRAVDVECSEADTAVLHFTSGSTGKLKAAVHTYGNRLALIRKSLMHPDGYVGPGGREILAGPITHASGMPMMGVFRAGGCVIVMRTWDPIEFLKTVEREKATHAFVVPTMINMILAVPDVGRFDLSTLKHLIYGGAPMSPARIRAAWKHLGPVLTQGFGCAETTSVVMLLSTDDHRRAIEDGDEELLLSCGRAIFDAEVRVVDEAGAQVAPGEIGELAVRGPDIAHGYHNEEALTAETFRGGWFHSGDLARYREDGYIFIVDRKKDMIISGGYNIYSVEVEAALLQHPGIFDAAVIGVPDEEWGEAVKAVVVPHPGVILDEVEVIEFCAARLSRLKKPRSVDVVSSLPVNQNGKTDRRAIRERFWTADGRRVA